MSNPSSHISRALHEWGVDKERLQEKPEDLLFSLTSKLNELGLEVGLATACIRTPHPQLDMLVFRWRPLTTEEIPTTTTRSIVGQRTIKRPDGVQDIYYMVHGHTNEKMWQTSPFRKVIDENVPLRVLLTPAPEEIPFPIIEDLMAREMTDYLVFPLNSDPKVSVAISLAIQRPNGFPPDFLAALESFLPILALSVAYKVERIQFREVLAAYIGKEPASLVFQGQIHRGDIFSRESTLGFLDVRGFTAASERLPTETLLDLLNTFFEYVYDAVYAVGGEILKFMGDGILFIVAGDKNPQQTCDLALKAIRTLIHSIAQYNKNPDVTPIDFGCGLHYGTVLYGNIGTNARLDFTVMGPAVNLASRLESLTKSVGVNCLMSAEFVKRTTITERYKCMGTHKLKGFATPQTVYAPMAAILRQTN